MQKHLWAYFCNTKNKEAAYARRAPKYESYKGTQKNENWMGMKNLLHTQQKLFSSQKASMMLSWIILADVEIKPRCTSTTEFYTNAAKMQQQHMAFSQWSTDSSFPIDKRNSFIAQDSGSDSSAKDEGTW